MSRLASETSRPIVGSVSLTGSFAIWLRAPWWRLVVPTLQRPAGHRPGRSADAASLGGRGRSIGSPAGTIRRRSTVSVVRRMLPLPEPGEARFLSDLLRSEPVGRAAGARPPPWWRWSGPTRPWDASYQSFVSFAARAARPRALGRRRRPDPVLLRGRARAEAGVRGRVATAAGRRGRAGGRGAVRGRRTGAALPRGQRGRADRAARRLGDPRGDRHRVRARGPGGRRARTCRRRCGRSC